MTTIFTTGENSILTIVVAAAAAAALVVVVSWIQTLNNRGSGRHDCHFKKLLLISKNRSKWHKKNTRKFILAKVSVFLFKWL